MTYRVLDSEDMNSYNPNKQVDRWADVVEGSLNYFEGMGFRLVGIEPAPEGGTALYILSNGKA